MSNALRRGPAESFVVGLLQAGLRLTGIKLALLNFPALKKFCQISLGLAPLSAAYHATAFTPSSSRYRTYSVGVKDSFAMKVSSGFSNGKILLLRVALTHQLAAGNRAELRGSDYAMRKKSELPSRPIAPLRLCPVSVSRPAVCNLPAVEAMIIDRNNGSCCVKTKQFYLFSVR